MYILHNGQIVQNSTTAISIENRGFMYGDGIFETMIVWNNSLMHLNEHLQRLNHGCQALSLKPHVELSADTIYTASKTLIDLNNITDNARIKLVIWRKSGGLFLPESTQAEWMILAYPFNAQKSDHINTVKFAKSVTLSFYPWSQNKTLSALPYVMAGIEARKYLLDDVLIKDQNNYIAEFHSSNVFWIRENTVFTPSIECGCVSGIMRKKTIKLLTQNNIQVKEGKFTESDLINSEVVFSTNIASIRYVHHIESSTYTCIHPYVEMLISSLCPWSI